MGTMADESAQRMQAWLKTGCNAFEAEHQKSAPLSFWLESDILAYLFLHKIQYASVYGETKCRYNGKECAIRSVRRCLTEYPNSDKKFKFYTTGVHRTGCTFCMFGAHLEKSPNRFERMAITHPKLHDYCIRSEAEKGLGLAAVLDYLKIKY